MLSTKRLLISAVFASIALAVTTGVAVRGQGSGVAGKVGQKLDEVGRGVGRSVKMGFESVRGEVGRMGLHPRVYSRIHWDKSLNGAKIEVHIVREGVVLLRGTVVDAADKKHAATLASETVGVTEVVDELVPLATEPVVPVNADAPKATSSTSTVPRVR